MVAVIKVSSSIHRILNYNESKVDEGKAVCLLAENYPVDAVSLTLHMKLSLFARQMDMNKNVIRNSLHISLNFDPSENGLGNERMIEIASSYMQQLGFGDQPYLVYRHFDAGHPHLHLVTTNIRHNGSRIDLHHLAIRKSEPARKKIEIDFGLVQAQGHRKGAPEEVVRVIEYGRSETRSAIQNVLEAVLDKYRYTSLSELNAILGIYNVRADRGAEGSRVSRHGGLLYRIVSANGEPLGIPIKASLFYNRPTLARLEIKFARNRITQGQHKSRIKNAIDKLPGEKQTSFSGVISSLAGQGITVVQRQNSDGRIYGLTYVDHQSGAVLNGSALGKAYSAKGMLERFPYGPANSKKNGGTQRQASEGLQALADGIAGADAKAGVLIRQIASIMETLTAMEYAVDYVPRQFSRKKKRKRKGQQGSN